MTALVLSDIANGHETQALQRMLIAYPGPFEKLDQNDSDPLQSPVLTAALLKLNGEPERARELLEEYLAFAQAGPEDHWETRKGWTPFTILAMLGETEAALDELETQVNTGYLHQWWALKDGAFDPDYAAVIAHPRFAALYQRITDRVAEQRAAYFAQPELPAGSIP
jgi:hypothetical protein